MKKVLLYTILLVSISAISVKAQDKGGLRIGIGPSITLPLGDFGKFYSVGVGCEVQGAYGITDNIAAFTQWEGSVFFPKSLKGEDLKAMSKVSFIAGGRYHYNGFSGGIAIGYSHFTISDGGSTGGFTYSPQIGYSVGKVDFILHYTGVALKDESFSSIGLKVFFNFMSGKK